MPRFGSWTRWGDGEGRGGASAGRGSGCVLTSAREATDHGFLADGHSAALVARDGTIDWWCPTRFDAPSVFGRLLDDTAGHWSLGPRPRTDRDDELAIEGGREWVGDSLVLRTRYRTATGVAEVTDALALQPGARGHDLGRRAPHVLIRSVRGDEGEVALRTTCAPRPEYGLVVPRVLADGDGVTFAGGPDVLRLDASVPLEVGAGRVRADFSVRPGDTVSFALSHAPAFGAGEPVRLDPAAALADTLEGWTSWAERHRSYRGRWAQQVRRSALILQGLTHGPSGAVVAAATTSLPEQPGGSLNFDYRYAWLRDLTLTMRALWVAACPDEANRLFDWIAVSAGEVGDEPLPIMFGVGGERDLGERTLHHLAGADGSRPVRVGNEAWRQRQLDVLGEVLDAAILLRDQLAPLPPQTQALLVALADQAAMSWQRDDAGMWEARDRERPYLSSKVLCWVALDRAVDLAPLLGGDADPQRWAKARDEVRASILARGWSDKAGAYTGAFGSDDLDASVLIMPLVGFLPAADERMRATVEGIERELGKDGVVYRWDGDVGGFTLCAYWLAECLALAGEHDRAVAWFEATTARANDLGLLAEMAPAGGGQVGNFPQAFSHVGLINAAWRLTQETT